MFICLSDKCLLSAYSVPPIRGMDPIPPPPELTHGFAQETERQKAVITN